MQEVWITIRIKSQLALEADAHAFALDLAESIRTGQRLNTDQHAFMIDAHGVDVIEVEEEAAIYDLENGMAGAKA